MTLVESLDSEGLLYPEISFPEYEDLFEALASGKIFSVIGVPWYFSKIKQMVKEKETEQVWEVAGIPKSDNLPYDVDAGGYSWLVVKKDDDDQESFIDFLVQIFNQNNDYSCETLRNLAEFYDLRFVWQCENCEYRGSFFDRYRM